MPLQQRDYRGAQDWQSIANLVQVDDRFYHRIDFPWRLCSTSLEDRRNAAVWEDEHGQMQVFAALQFPWLDFDCVIHPSVRNPALELQVIQWGDARLRQIAAETNSEFPFNISALASEPARISFLESQGYVRWDHWMVWFKRSLQELPEVHIPSGFTIRPLAGESEVEEYAALQRRAFDSTTMTALWRSHTLHAPLYNPELDLVAVAPDGRMVGFCIWWYAPRLKTAQIEPLGIHPDFQQVGLSRALMAEGMRRAAMLGAETTHVETYSFSEPALKAYQAIGFQEIGQELKFYKDY